MSTCRKLTNAIKGLYDSAVCRKGKIQCGIAPRQTKEAGLGRPASGQNSSRRPSAGERSGVVHRHSFFGDIEIVVLNVAVSDYVNNLFRVDERQALRFITIANSKDLII